VTKQIPANKLFRFLQRQTKTESYNIDNTTSYLKYQNFKSFTAVKVIVVWI